MGQLRLWVERYRRGEFGMPEVVLLSIGVGVAVTVVMVVLTRLM